jgi:hypothetical protein
VRPADPEPASQLEAYRDLVEALLHVIQAQNTLIRGLQLELLALRTPR